MLSFLRVKSGVEIRVHTVRAWTQRHDDSHGKVLLKLVFANAFNRVCRQTALTRTTSTFPGITRVGWLGATNIFRPFGLAQPPSSPRVGCNKGPPAVRRRYPRLNARSSSRAAAIHALTQDLRAGPLDLALFYLDDGIGAGDVAAVGPYLHPGIRAWPYDEPSKCGFAGVGSVQPDDLTGHFPAEQLWIPRRCYWRWWFCAHHPQAPVEVRPLLEALSSLGGARCSACVPAMAECCMACGATRPIVSPQSYNSLTLWCKQRFPASPAFTSTPLCLPSQTFSLSSNSTPLLQFTDLQSLFWLHLSAPPPWPQFTDLQFQSTLYLQFHPPALLHRPSV